MAVTDDNLLTLADDKQGRLPAHLLLESELKGRIEDPDFYFDPNEPKALLPHDLHLRYAVRTPPFSPDCPLRLETSLTADQTLTGSTVRLGAVVKNTGGDAQPAPMVHLGIPAGLTPQPWQLKALVEQGVVDFYEQQSGHVVFYMIERKTHWSLANGM